MIHRPALRLFALAGAAAASVGVKAQSVPNPDRPWFVSLGQEIEHHSNATQAPRGQEASDTVYTTTLSGGLNARFGRQRAYVNASTAYSTYQKTEGLNQPGYTLNAGLDWQTIGNLSGALTVAAGRRQSDFTTISTVALKNRETYDELGARVLWGGVGLLGVEGTVGTRRLRFSAPEFSAREYDQGGISAGVVYRPSSLLALGAGVSLQNTDYDVPLFGQTVPESNERRDIYLRADWTASGASVIGGRVNIGKIDYVRPNADDFRGLTGSVFWNWRPTGRTSVSTNLSRDSGQESGFQRLTTGQRVRLTATDFSRITNLAAVTVNYELTGKIMMLGTANYARRSLDDALTGTRGSDNTTTMTLGARWVATRVVSLTCTLGYESRSSSSTVSYSYRDNTVGCLGQVTLD